MILAIASGNGGSGATTLVASFVALAGNKVIADWTHPLIICRGKSNY